VAIGSGVGQGQVVPEAGTKVPNAEAGRGAR
jgi:hypothetical protein